MTATGPDEATLTQLTEFALLLAGTAKSAILPFFRGAPVTHNKAGAGRFDPVTEADRAAEAALRTAIEARYPDHGILGEEYGEHAGGSDFRWVLDPIDGTRTFLIGGLHWGSLIALEFEGRPIIGVLAQPATGEVFLGAPGLGRAELHRSGAISPLRCKPTPRLNEATYSTTHTDFFTNRAELEAHNALSDAVKLALYGGDCYMYALIALGGHDLVLEAGLKPYDTAALVPIIEAAGGRMTDWQGRPSPMGGQVLASSGGDLHDQALALIAGAGAPSTGLA
ncbi:MAG: inositol monophosphatase family protein [Pseudomonadota bacterium]